MQVFRGGCHCGNVEVDYRSDVDPSEAFIRACQCSFCRKHNTRALSDPAGALEIVANDPGHLVRYRFGLETADFLICGRCGVYVAAVMDDGEMAFATLMVSVLDDARAFTQTAAPFDYGTEDAPARRQRRRERWTPATVRIDQA